MTPKPSPAVERSKARPNYKLWVNDTYTLTIRQWEDDTTEASSRESQADPWDDWQLMTKVEPR